MKKLIVGFLAVAFFAPVVVFAFAIHPDCTGDSVEICNAKSALGSIASPSGSQEEKINILQQVLAQLTAVLSNLLAKKGDPSTTQIGCFVPTYDLYIGRTDAQTNGEVKKLQLWLKAEGYFPDAQGTGYYGEKTAAAVTKWQKAHGMDFVTTKSGVGKMTRAKMQEACGSDSTFEGTYNWDSAGMTGLPDSFTPYGEVGTLYFLENQDQVRIKIFGITSLPYSGSDSCNVSRENVKLRVSIQQPSGKIIVKEVLSTGHLSPVKCATAVAQCATYESKPIITSITPLSGPVGTTIEIQGCNFLGFEGDKELWFTNSKGEKGLLNGQSDAATRASNAVMRVTLAPKLCQVNSYSGLQCPLMELVPGVYTVYSNSWGGKSNVVNFTVTAQ